MKPNGDAPEPFYVEERDRTVRSDGNEDVIQLEKIDFTPVEDTIFEKALPQG